MVSYLYIYIYIYSISIYIYIYMFTVYICNIHTPQDASVYMATATWNPSVNSGSCGGGWEDEFPSIAVY